MKFAHIINPVKVDSDSDLYHAQPVTFESLRRAREFSRSGLEVILLSAQYPEDREIIPDHIKTTPDLTRSVLNLRSFRKKKKLPLIRDILDRAFVASEGCDYLVYTNADIAVQPFFYEFLERTITLGVDSFVINRRTIDEAYGHPSQLALLCAEIGRAHPGHDCFVFPRENLSRFILEDTIIGANWIGRVLMWNIVLQASNFREYRDNNVTFHLGDDRVWEGREFDEYAAFNYEQARKVHQKIRSLNGVSLKKSAYLSELERDELGVRPNGFPSVDGSSGRGVPQERTVQFGARLKRKIERILRVK